MKSATHDVDGFGSKIGSVVGGIAKAGLFAGVAAGVVGVSAVLHAGISEWEQSAQAASQTEAVLKSTGGAANVTAAQVDALSQAMLAKTGIDDEVIKSGENLLLTFTQIRNETGKGNDVFDQATRAATDLSVAMHTSLESAAVQVGKALNDPARGMARLQRVGVAFTEEQKEMVKALVKTGDTIGAQKVILKELNKEFGGSAEAFGKTLPGKLTIAKEAFNNLSGQLVGAVAPAFTTVLTAANNFLTRLSAADGFKAKVGVIFDEAKNVAGTLATTIGSAVAAVDWAAVWGQAKGIGAGLAAQFEAIDWGGIGTTIGDSLSAAVGASISATGGLPTKILEVVDSIDWNRMGRAMGPGLAAAMVMAFTTLFDIGFWVKNWDLALAVALIAFSGPIGRLAGRLLVPFVRLGEDLALGIAGAFTHISPKIGEAVLVALMKIPGLVTGVLGKLVGLVSSIFGRLSRLAVFTLKVLGVREVIDKVSEVVGNIIDWLKKLPPAWLKGGLESLAGFVKGLVLGFVSVQAWLAGMFLKVVGFFAGAAGWLVSAGAALIGGFISGITSKLGDLKNTLTGIGGKVVGWKGPPAKDAVMLYQAGRLVIGGFIAGIQSQFGNVRSALSEHTRNVLAEINKLQAAIDKVNRRREDEDLASAVRNAQTTLSQLRADSKSKQTDIVAAEVALTRAQEDVRVAAKQRQLNADQAHYDKAKAALDAANQRINDAQQKASDRYNDILAKARTRAGTSFDRLADLVRRGFQAVSDAWVSPAQRALDAITDRRGREDLASAVSDAQDRLSQALEGDDPGAVADAQRALDRAKEDVLVAGLQRQAAIEQTAHDQQEQARADQLDRLLTRLRGHFTNEGLETSKGLDAILALIKTYDDGFGGAGKLLGEAFARELRAAMKAAVGKAAEVADVKAGGGGTSSSLADVSASILGTARGVFSNLSASPTVAAAGGGGDTYHVTVNGLVGGASDVAQAVRNELLKFKRANGTLGLA